MKREDLFTGLVSAVLSFMLSMSAVDCMITGFHLPVERTFILTLISLTFSVVCTLCFLYKRGVVLFISSAALLTLILWRSYQALEQCLALISRVTDRYDQVYGWGVIRLGQDNWRLASADYPMVFLACLIVLTISWTVCCRKRAWLAVTVTVLPLIICLVTTDTVPSEWCLFFLIFGLILLIMTNTVRRKDPTQANLLTGMVAIPAMIALLILFLAVPQEGYVNQVETYQDQVLGLLGQANLDAPEEDDTTGTVDLRNAGPRVLSTRPVLEVTTPASEVLYLREQDYNAYDGTGWTASLYRSEKFPPTALTTVGEAVGTVTVETRQVQERMFLPYYPAEVELTDGRIDNTDKVTRYEWQQQVLPDGWRESLISKETDVVQSEDGLQFYRNLPYKTRTWASELVNRILTDKSSATAIADQIGDYVRSSARYDLNTPNMPEEETDFARWFLEGSDTGYCVHFATASVVLMRAAGLEARYVTGYMVSTSANEATTVRANRAHAWAEYYEPQLGVWIVLESTPADELNQAPIEDTASQSETSSIPVELEEHEQKPQEQRFVVPPWTKNLLTGILLTAVFLAAAVIQRMIRLRSRERTLKQKKANGRALVYWREAVLLSRLLKLSPPRRLKQLAEKAKFSQYTLTDDELQVFSDYLEEAKQKLHTHPWYRQLVYRYIFAIY